MAGLRPSSVRNWLWRRLPARATARLLLRYWRLEAALARRLPWAGRPSAMGTLSHGAVLALGLLLVLPALPASGRYGRSVTPVVAQAGPVTPSGLGLVRIAGQLSALDIERRDNPPPTPPPPAP